MVGALFFLQYNSWKNRLRARVRRLKNPKYLVGAIVGGMYLILYFANLMFGARLLHGQDAAQPTGLAAIGENFGALLLLTFIVMRWFFPGDRAALAFTEAEVAFLFPAPITRRGLIHYKLLRSQIVIFISTLFLTLISGRWIHLRQAWISIFGCWIILSAINLHLLVASFTRTLMLDRGITNTRRRALIVLLLLAGVGVAALGTYPPLPPPGSNLNAILSWARLAMSSGTLQYLLLPFKWVVAPYFAANASGFFFALGPALAILAAHYYLVMHMDVSFEEASLDYSQKIASRMAAFRASRAGGAAAIVPKTAQRPPFALAPIGHPSLALLWKNLIMAGHLFTLRFFLFLAFLTFAMSIGFWSHRHQSSIWVIVGTLAQILLFMSIFIGPSWLRLDFRADLERVDILKLYPVAGWKIVLGEILAPAMVLLAGQFLLVMIAAVFAEMPEGEVLSLSTRVGFMVAALLLLPAVDLLIFLIPNAAALLMPGWVRLNRDVAGGMENVGQAVVLMMGQMFVMAVALVPAALCGGVVLAVGASLLPTGVATPLAALVAASVLLGEAAVAIYFLGRAFERFDLSAELSP